MKNICVITGGGSGMGFEAAKLIGKEQKIILVGRTVSKLEDAINQLHSKNIDAEAYPCDAADRESVKQLATYVAQQGTLKTVIHAAGVSPHMASAENIFAINAIGTINIDEELSAVMPAGGCILNVSSMSAYMLPADRQPAQLYELALTDTNALMAAATKMFDAVPEAQRTGMAYTISKNFVIWYTTRMAVRCGKKGIRVVSISPGTFSTPMGDIEGEQAASFALRGALGRVGEPIEIAKMMAFIVSDNCSYMTGVDVLYDGGAIAALQASRDVQK